MTAWQIALAVAIPILAVAGLVLLLYYVWFPRVLVKKFRSGEDGVSMPDNYESMQNAVEVERDLRYTSAFENNTYDVYRPKNAVTRGVVVWVHGGFFIAGDKRGTENLCTFLASRGVTVVTMNYALAPERKHPTAVLQLGELLAHIRLDPALDASRVVIAGDSAGGQIVSEYALLFNRTDLQQKSGIKLSPTVLDIAAVILVCAPLDIGLLKGHNKKLDLLLPTFGRAYYGSGKWYKNKKLAFTKVIENATESYPPTFLTDGNHMSFESQNKTFAAALKSRGVQTSELFFDDDKVEHEYLFKMSDERAMQAAERIYDFITEKLGRIQP